MIITVIMACLVLIFYIKYLRTLNHRGHRLLKQFPSYPTYPLIGNLNKLFGSSNDILWKFEKILQPHDRLVFWFGPMPLIVLKKYDDILRILNQCHDRDTHEFGLQWSEVGILNARYEEWKTSRKLLASAFNSEMLSKYLDVIRHKALILVNQLEEAAEKDEIVDIWEYVLGANTDAIIENTIGASLRSIGKNAREFGDVCSKALQNITERVLNIWLYPHFMYSLYLRFTGKIKLINDFNYLLTKELQRNLSDFRDRKNQFEDNDSHKTITDVLIKKNQQDPIITKTRMKDELLQIMAAGIETSALNVSFLMLMLAIHRDIQEKVYEEITQTLGDTETPTLDQLTNNLKYLEQCIKETGRMFSPVEVTGRRTHKDCTLKDNKIIPAGTIVLLHLHLAHYDDDLYENPQTWDPQHFSEEAEANPPRGSSLMFGYRARSCIGYKYAVISIKTQIISILRTYHLSTNINEITRDMLTSDLCIRSKIGYPIKFTRR